MNEEASRFLSALTACGWFKGLPEAAAADVCSGVAAALRFAQWVGLVSVAIDSAYLLDDEPYAALVAQFADASHGVFRPADIRVTHGESLACLAFRVGDLSYALDLPGEADDVPGEFVDTINRAMAESGTALRFVEIHDLNWGPIPGFALTSPKAHQRAVATKLLPGATGSRHDLSEEDLARFGTTIEKALLGRQTFCWTLEDQTVAEASVPGTFDDDTTDDRPKGEGMMTILEYNGVGEYDAVGTMTFHCGPPADDHQGLPKGFRQQESRQTEDRISLIGQRKLKGVEMAWRQDRILAAPIHLWFCVKESLGDLFSEALDSFRLLERTPQIEAIFAACLAPRQRQARARPKTGRAKSARKR